MSKAPLRSFRDLEAWKKAHKLTLSVYGKTKNFPADERFGLVAQLRRSCASIPTNIVEGFKRRSNKDQAHFFNMAESSLEETKYQLILSHDLGYILDREFEPLMEIADEIGRMLNAYRQSISRRTSLTFSCSILFLILNSYFLILQLRNLS